MIHQLSQNIANFLLSNHAIKDEEYEIYTYGYEMLFLGIVDFVISVVFGIAFQEIINALIFFVMFVTVRVYTGGYHADNVITCKVVFAIITFFVLLLSTYLTEPIPLQTVLLILFLFSTSVYAFAPLENPNKPMTAREKKKYHFMGWISTLFWSAFAIVMNCIDSSITVTTISTAAFITIGGNKMKNTLLRIIAAVGRKSATTASGTASGFGCYQPKEPKALQNLKK